MDVYNVGTVYKTGHVQVAEDVAIRDLLLIFFC